MIITSGENTWSGEITDKQYMSSTSMWIMGALLILFLITALTVSIESKKRGKLCLSGVFTMCIMILLISFAVLRIWEPGCQAASRSHGKVLLEDLEKRSQGSITSMNDQVQKFTGTGEDQQGVLENVPLVTKSKRLICSVQYNFTPFIYGEPAQPFEAIKYTATCKDEKAPGR